MIKPKIISQLNFQTGMGRQGGSSSKASSPSVDGIDSSLTAMKNALIRGATPSPKGLSGSGTGRQFDTKAAKADLGAGALKPMKVRRPKV